MLTTSTLWNDPQANMGALARVATPMLLALAPGLRSISAAFVTLAILWHTMGLRGHVNLAMILLALFATQLLLVCAAGPEGQQAAQTDEVVSLDFALSLALGEAVGKYLRELQGQGRTKIRTAELKSMVEMARMAAANPGPSSVISQLNLPPPATAVASKKGVTNVVNGKLVKELGEGLCKVHGPDAEWMNNGHYDSLRSSLDYARTALQCWLKKQPIPDPPVTTPKRKEEALKQVNSVSMLRTALDYKNNHVLMAQFRPFYLHKMLTHDEGREGRTFIAQLLFDTSYDVWRSWDPRTSAKAPPQIESIISQISNQAPVLIQSGMPLNEKIHNFFRNRLSAGEESLSASAIKQKYTGARKLMWACGMEFDPEAKFMGPGSLTVLTDAHVVKLTDPEVRAVLPLNPFSADVHKNMRDVQLKYYRPVGEADDAANDAIDARGGSSYHSQAYTNAKMFEERARCQKALNEAIIAANDINRPPKKGGFRVGMAAMVLWASTMRLVRGCRPSDPIQDNFYNTASFLVHLPALDKTIEVPVAFCATEEGAAFLQDYFMSGDAPYVLRCAHNKMYSDPKPNEGVPGPSQKIKYDAHVAYAWPISMFNVPIVMCTVMSIMFRYYGTSYELYKAGVGRFDRGAARLGIMRIASTGACANIADDKGSRILELSTRLGIFPEPDKNSIRPGTPEKHTPESSRYLVCNCVP